ncbi:C26 family cysteine hydrolase domain-containing family (plasmid) [Rhizobium lusitanum]|uniref:glutamine amidotransferase-related protein n=1 Tax=Rhizobium lusitanum TaxID=293958 RepID=UPI00161F1AA4|nr:gamma-glutamyl-gamma-aminobutyrate hydrolase family protein [Rhizobium lusitanum]QND46115.1 C26 family cysteine hydrolase domain-containing family [Rhizobium lusitanum]
MGLILVLHDTSRPALYGAVAAAVAAARQYSFMHVAARFDTKLHADAAQHVIASGGLGPSGLCWFERLSGKQAPPVATSESILDAARMQDVVVPIHPAFLVDQDMPTALSSAAEALGIEVKAITVREDSDCFFDAATQELLALRDRFGRIELRARPFWEGDSLMIGLIGAESDHRDVYPAALASLADAADSLSIPINVRFIDPVNMDQFEDPAVFEGLSGILLPGGADMKNVAGQTTAAALSLEAGLPTVGLCLGMQTMATAVAWRAFGRGTANLAEADPDAKLKTFVPMAGAQGPDETLLPLHRTGDQAIDIVSGTQLAVIIRSDRQIRCNHRFRLNQALLPDLEAAGLRVAASSSSGAIVDAIEVPGHSFFIGMQGHPELSSRADMPHPLLVAFLETAAKRRPSTMS